jgi:hypothetical protein
MGIMRKSKSILAGAAIAAGLAMSASVFGSTGNFTSPLTNAFLSVDMNGGGPFSSVTAPTNGWNENTGSGAFTADPFGVLWSPWGGTLYSGGDGTQLPSSQSSPNVNAASINKTFTVNGPGPSYAALDVPIPPVGVTLSIDTTNNSGRYATVNGAPSFNSRDRGTPSGPNGANDNDMFRDLLFAGTSGSNVQGTNYMQVQITLLTPGAQYEIALYSYDSSGSHTTNWTATAPTNNGNTGSGGDGWWDGTADNTFTAPSDEQSVTWTAGTAPAPAIFTETASPSGTITLYGFGGTGVTGNQSADTTYLNGFQIAAVPEPASIGLLGFASLALLGRRRH